jgi:hypothetical protein
MTGKEVYRQDGLVLAGAETIRLDLRGGEGGALVKGLYLVRVRFGGEAYDGTVVVR